MPFTPDEMHSLLNPTSIAVVGASDKSVWSTQIVDNLTRFGFAGQLHMVNPRHESVLGRESHASIGAIPAAVDHALVVAPAATLKSVLPDAAAAGVRGITVVASGFEESGDEFTSWVRDFCLENRIALIGPNCFGFANFFSKAFVTRNTFEGVRPPGPIGLAFQSGGLNLDACKIAHARGIDLGFSVSSGNELVVDTNDYYEYFLQREDIRVIGGSLERIPDPDRFADIADRARIQGKPLVVLKLGRSEIAQTLAVAHTGSIAGADAVVDTFLRDVGVIRVDSIDELVDTAGLLGRGHWPRGPRSFFLSFTGGTCGLFSDLAEGTGMVLEPVSDGLRSEIADVTGLAPGAVHNPLDPTTEGIHHLESILEAVVRSGDYDTVLLHTSEPRSSEAVPLAQTFIETLRSVRDQGLFVAAFGGVQIDPTEVGIAATREWGVPYVHGPIGVRALDNAVKYGRIQASMRERFVPSVGIPDRDEVAALLSDSGPSISEVTSKKLFDLYGIASPLEGLALTENEAVEIATRVGFPVVLKIVSKDIGHKSDAGCVLLGVKDEAGVREGYRTVLANARAHAPGGHVDGVLVAEEITGAAEFFLGITGDDAMGPVVVAGLGGIYVELLRDTVSALVPVSPERAKQLLMTLRSAPMFAGARTGVSLDLDAFALAMSRVSWLAHENRSRLAELDINPLFVRPEGLGVRAADGLVVLKP